jgi:predicted transcriptional regulator
MNGIASSNIRRQLKRLRDIYLVEKVRNTYRINENEDISVIFTEKIEKFYLPSILERIKEYLKALR